MLTRWAIAFQNFDFTVKHIPWKLNIIPDRLSRLFEGFNDWGGRGYDDFVPGEVTKTAPSGDETT